MGTDSAAGFFAVTIAELKKLTRDIPFDVHLRLSGGDSFPHVFSKATGLDYKRLAQYESRGVSELYLRAEDREAWEAFSKVSADSIAADPLSSLEKRTAALVNMTEQAMADLFARVDVDDETAARTQKVVSRYVDFLASEPKSLALLLNLVSHGDYLYYHSVSVSVFTLFLARATGVFNTLMLERLGLGGFLHDIGCTQLPKELVSGKTELTEGDWEVMRTHPKVGLRMLEAAPKIPTEVRHIVYQHHEEPGGKGYPNRLAGTAVYYPAKIVAVADAFSALISRRPFRPAYSVGEAIALLEAGKGKHDPGVVGLLSMIFRSQAATRKAA